MDVLHQPVEDGDIAVDGDVNVVERFLVTQVLLKVLHAVEQQCAVTAEVLRGLLAFIAHVNENLVLCSNLGTCRSCIGCRPIERLLCHSAQIGRNIASSDCRCDLVRVLIVGKRRDFLPVAGQTSIILRVYDLLV